MRAVQPLWDIYEAVILLEGYLEACKHKQPKSQIIKRVSNDLRNMALNRGITIDNIYRNENGISYQMQSMESAFVGHRIYIHSTKLFCETVRLYKNDFDKYQAILMEAKSMIAAKKTNQDEFYAWLSKNISSEQLSEYYLCYHEVEEYAKKIKIIKESLFEITDPNIIVNIQNRIISQRVFDHSYGTHFKNTNLAIRWLIVYLKEKAAVSQSISKTSGVDLSPVKNTVIPAKATTTNIATRIGSKNQTVDFYHINSLSFTKPTRVTYFDDEICSDCSWKFVYISTIIALNEDYPDVFSSIKSFPGSLRVEFGNLYESIDMISPQQITPSLFVETNFSATDIVRKIASLLDICNVDYENLVIEYETKDTVIKNEAIPGMPKPEVPKIPENDGIIKVMKSHYEYGFRYNSIIEIMKFRQFAQEMGVKIPESDEQLKSSIIASGTIIDDRVFCKSEDFGDELKDIVDGIFADGCSVIYYESLLEIQSEWMDRHKITSESILKEYLQKHISNCSFTKNFLVKGPKQTEKKAVEEEIIRVWGKQQTQKLIYLKEKLPYIPFNNIFRTISGNDLFVLSGEGEYLYIELFRLSEKECEDIIEYIENVCSENGFVSLADIPIDSVMEDNYELSATTVLNSICKRLLSKHYYINGKILTRDNPELGIVSLLKEYIRGRDEVTYNEVSDKVIEFTGNTDRDRTLKVLYDNMIRVDEHHFVSERFISFDVEEIDSVISQFIRDRFISLRDVTSFALFPVCGKSWNHFLLESYLYRYSKKYTLRVIHFNDKNVGIITEKLNNNTYDQLLEMELARTNIALTEEICGKYLFDTGYLTKNKYIKLPEIIAEAKKMRKER